MLAAIHQTQKTGHFIKWKPITKLLDTLKLFNLKVSAQTATMKYLI